VKPNREVAEKAEPVQTERIDLQSIVYGDSSEYSRKDSILPERLKDWKPAWRKWSK